MSSTLSSASPVIAPKVPLSQAPLADILPAAELAKPPMFRHIDFFDENKDGILTIPEIAHGLIRDDMAKATAWLVSAGTVIVRGHATTGKFDLKINIANAFKSAQDGSSGIFAPDGSVDQPKLDALVTSLDPHGNDRITLADFQAHGAEQAKERVPGNSLMDHAERAKMEFEVKLAWSGVFNLMNRSLPDGTKYLTRLDVQSFYDGSLFYRKAEEVKEAAAAAAA